MAFRTSREEYEFPSHKMNRTFFSILFFSLLKRVIISITVLLVTRILLDSNWAFLLKPLSLLHFLPNKQRPYSNKGALARKPTQANAQPFSCWVLPPLTLPGYGFPFTRIPRLWNPFDLSLHSFNEALSSFPSLSSWLDP